MIRTATTALVLAATLLAPTIAAAKVYMCVDATTGKKTFTDRACPDSRAPGKKVRVESQTRANHHGLNREPVWNADRNRSVSGRANLDEKPRVATSVSGNGLLGIDS